MKSLDTLDVDVLVVGGGASGLSISILLSRMEVDHLVVERHPSTSKLPKAHYLNSRTMEIFDQMQVADAVYRKGMPLDNNATSWYTSLGGDDPSDGRVIHEMDSFGGRSLADHYAQTSAYPGTNLPQKYLEPLLRERAEHLNRGKVLFGQEVVSLELHEEWVDATVVERSTGESTRVRARYVVGADGGRFVGPTLGIKMEGTPAFVNVVGIHFAADLSRYLKDDDALIRRIVRMQDNGELLVSGLVTMGPTRWDRYSEEWHVTPIVPIGATSPVHDVPSAIDHIRTVLKLPDLEPEIIELSNWRVEGVLARRFRYGRAFLVGDAAHRHPPTTGLGLNSAVHDVHNLAWKIAHVLRGNAGHALLDSYEDERRPATKRNVEWAMFTYFNNLATRAGWGVLPGAPIEHNRAAWNSLFAATDDGESRRARLAEYLNTQRTEYQARDIELGVAYTDSKAITHDGSPQPPRDPLGGTHVQTARPGHRLPHAPVQLDGEIISTYHLVSGVNTFTLIAGSESAPWLEAVGPVARDLGVSVTTWRVVDRHDSIGDAATVVDVTGDWCSVRGHGDAGVVLVRPDGHVAFRAQGPGPDAAADLRRALETALGVSPALLGSPQGDPEYVTGGGRT